MTALDQHTREKLKERLIAFLKTLPGLVAENQWATFEVRLHNCNDIKNQIYAIEGRVPIPPQGGSRTAPPKHS